MAPRPLQPVPQPLAKFERMVARQSQTLVIKELLDSFTIETLDKKLWMKVKAQRVSLHDCKTAYPPGQPADPLFDIVRERHLLPRKTTFSIQDRQDHKKEFMKVRRRFSGRSSQLKTTKALDNGHTDN